MIMMITTHFSHFCWATECFLSGKRKKSKTGYKNGPPLSSDIRLIICRGDKAAGSVSSDFDIRGSVLRVQVCWKRLKHVIWCCCVHSTAEETCCDVWEAGCDVTESLRVGDPPAREKPRTSLLPCEKPFESEQTTKGRFSCPWHTFLKYLWRDDILHQHWNVQIYLLCKEMNLPGFNSPGVSLCLLRKWRHIPLFLCLTSTRCVFSDLFVVFLCRVQAGLLSWVVSFAGICREPDGHYVLDFSQHE